MGVYDACRFKTTIDEFEFTHAGVVVDVNAVALSTEVVGIDQRLTATHKKSIGTRSMQGA